MPVPTIAAMSPQRRIALVSVGAACLLIAIKLAAGLASGSLGLLAEAAHSGTDLAAALLTFFAVSVAVRPADRGHPFGHAKAQNLAALAEAAFLIGVSLVIAAVAVARLAGAVGFEVDATWWTFAAIATVIAIDASRVVVSMRAARAYRSDALQASAVHFGSDLAGTLAVLAGLSAAALGFPEGDAIAALFVAALVVLAATRLLRRNVGVLMDRAPEEAEVRARAAILALQPPVELRRVRVREAGGHHFADVVIGVAPDAAVGQGHTAADRVEEAVRTRFPDADVVVHVEPHHADAEVRERVLAAALVVPRVREIHNLVVLDVDGRVEVSLHLKLPGDLPLEEAHDVAEEVEHAILTAVSEVEGVQTHLEPLSETFAAHPVEAADRELVEQVVREETGVAPREVRFVLTDDGLVAFITLALGRRESLTDAHTRASAVEERVRSAVPEIVDVVIHTEP
jgi:cation diffusion facilitator family transporter